MVFFFLLKLIKYFLTCTIFVESSCIWTLVGSGGLRRGCNCSISGSKELYRKVMFVLFFSLYAVHGHTLAVHSFIYFFLELTGHFWDFHI